MQKPVLSRYRGPIYSLFDLQQAFDLKCVIPEIEGVGEPVLLYLDV